MARYIGFFPPPDPDNNFGIIPITTQFLKKKINKWAYDKRKLVFISSSATITQTLTLPSNIVSGDIIFFLSTARITSDFLPASVPNGFTTVKSDQYSYFISPTTYYAVSTVAYKIATNSDASATITTNYNSPQQVYTQVVVFRNEVSAITSCSFHSIQSYVATVDNEVMPTHTINASSLNKQGVFFGYFYKNNIVVNTPVFSSGFDGGYDSDYTQIKFYAKNNLEKVLSITATTNTVFRPQNYMLTFYMVIN